MRILVVDDQPDTQYLFEKLIVPELARPDWIFTYADGGQAALLFLADTETDLVLLDLMMPDMDGLDVLKHIKTNWPTMTVIMLSGFTDLEHLRAAMNRRAYDFLPKPVTLKDLRATLEKAEEEIQEKRLVAKHLRQAQRDIDLAYRMIAHTDSVIASIKRQGTEKIHAQ